jgi:hypothetical protein
MYATCDYCQELRDDVKMIVIAIRTETAVDELSANRMEFKQVPVCAECRATQRKNLRVCVT